MTTQLFLNSLLFTAQPFRWNKSPRSSVNLHCLILIREWSM